MSANRLVHWTSGRRNQQAVSMCYESSQTIEVLASLGPAPCRTVAGVTATAPMGVPREQVAAAVARSDHDAARAVGDVHAGTTNGWRGVC